MHPHPDLYLFCQRIPYVSETRFLGLIFDHRLTWIPHLNSPKSKCLEAKQILRALSHTNLGADRQMLLRLYHSLISKLNYGREIYSSAEKNSLKILDSVHHARISLPTGAFKSSIPSLLVDAREISPSITSPVSNCPLLGCIEEISQFPCFSSSK